MARGSAFETAAALTLLRAEAALSAEQYSAAKQLVIRVMAMLTNLAKRPVPTPRADGDQDQHQHHHQAVPR